MTKGYKGGAPLLHDALALDLANTHYGVRGKTAEGLKSASDLSAWLGAVLPKGVTKDAALAVDAQDVERFIELRSAVRGVSAALTSGSAVKPADVTVINNAAQIAPSWPVLEARASGELAAKSQTKVPELSQALASFAADAIDLFAGERAQHLRACQAPGCPLFFLKDHPRREWCSPACGARVRSARAYKKKIAANA